MRDNPKIDAVIKLLDAGGLTREDLHTATLAQVIKLRNVLYNWHELADLEIEKRVEQAR
jgi:hypothetical protein